MNPVSAHAVNPQFPELLRGWRKIRKFSQLALALNASISQRHLSFLESGRSSPSREMVLLLSTSLELPFRETNVLLNAAGYAHVFSESKLDHKVLKLANQALTVMLKHHEPYGATVIDRNWNIQMMNEAAIRIFSLFVDPISVWNDIGNKVPNTIRITLHPLGIRQYLVNWQEIAVYFIEQLNKELVSNPFNHEATDLLNEIRNYPGMSDLVVVPHDLLRPVLPMILRKGELELQFFTMVSTFGTPQDVTLQEIRIETLFPADDATEQFVCALS